MHSPECRFCAEPLTHVLCDLGMSPLANSYVNFENSQNAEKIYPLKVWVCPKCLLAQLEGFDLNEFQKEFGVDPCNPMYDCYEVKVANIPFLKRYLPKLVGINWDFNNYAYFVEAVEN